MICVIKKILIANRGEIAVRIIRACREMGIETVAVYSEADAEALHTKLADEAVCIGPPANVIAKLGNKQEARNTMEAAGVPVIPGSKEPVCEVHTGLLLAREIGYPVIIKAALGGGGKGMRVSRSKDDFEFNFNMAQRESANAFGDDTMYIEKYIENPRHVEIQIMADTHGNVVALGERDCSVQRNHQKLIEESPSPAITANTRAPQIGRAHV